jgi:ABC-2 type transport system permease protein
MAKSYSQFRAMLSLAKASIISMLHSPTSIVFSILFPVIFIVVFGSLVDATIAPLKVVFTPGSDTSSSLFQSIKKIPNLTIVKDRSLSEARELLKKGSLTAIIELKKDTGTVSHYQLHVTSGVSTPKTNALLRLFLKNTIQSLDEKMYPGNPSNATMVVDELPGQIHRKIDFILPGQLGFSLLMAGIFGSAFLLFNLRKGQVLRRLAATPISRSQIILGELLSRLIFHVFSFIIMIAIGYFVFDFTLVNGFFTLLEMLIFSLLGLIIFMGIGFIISGAIQNESSVAPVANTFTLPQILLCGLFFPIENYPHWLQSFCDLLPLTFLVDGLRKIGFEGVHIWEMPVQLTGLIIWAIATSFVAVRAFKWE